MKRPARVLITIIILFFFSVRISSTENLIEVSAGRSIDVVLDSAIDSDNLSLGYLIYAVLPHNFYDDSNLIVPADSKIEGKVTHIKSQDTDSNAEVKIEFTTIITPDGKHISCLAIIETKDGTGVLYGKGLSKVNKFKKAFLGIGKSTVTTIAKTEAIKAITPKNIRNAFKYTATAGAGVSIAKDIKAGDNKDAAKKTAEQVVKYTPYGAAYKYGKAAVKGAQQAKNSYSDEENSVGSPVILKSGTKLDLILQQPLKVSETVF